MLDSWSGLTWMRTAGRTLPAMVTRPTPCTWARRWARIESAMPLISRSGTVAEDSLRVMIGASAGFTRL